MLIRHFSIPGGKKSPWPWLALGLTILSPPYSPYSPFLPDQASIYKRRLHHGKSPPSEWSPSLSTNLLSCLSHIELSGSTSVFISFYLSLLPILFCVSSEMSPLLFGMRLWQFGFIWKCSTQMTFRECVSYLGVLGHQICVSTVLLSEGLRLEPWESWHLGLTKSSDHCHYHKWQLLPEPS